MVDIRVQETQTWLNTTYGSVDGWVTLDVNGLTGWDTIYGLRRGLQHELGISPVSSGFGSATTAAFISQIGAIGSATTSQNLLRLLSGALWCKGDGLSGTAFDTTINFDDLLDSVSTARARLGLASPPAVVDVKLMASLMSMDAYTTLSGQGGTDGVRTVEQWLNATYSTRQNFALVPCDGVFSRQIQTAVLYGLQYEFGMDGATANGNFGPGTRTGLATRAPIAEGDADSGHHFVHLFQGLLRFNGYGSAPFSGFFDAATASQTSAFQSFMELGASGAGDYGTWCALLVSSGDPDRAVTGFDASVQLSPAQASAAAAAGFTHVGRYTTGVNSDGTNRFLGAGELAGFKAAGLALFPLQQRYNNSDAVMTLDEGSSQANEALERCRLLGLPAGSVIYFAVDYDPTGDEISGPVTSFFTGINNGMASQLLGSYRIGVYGTRNVCTAMMGAGKAVSAFVAGMSTGWSGNMGFRMPDPWAYNQITETTAGWAGASIGVDHDAVSAHAAAVDLASVTPPPTEKDGASTATGFDTVYQWTISAEAKCERALKAGNSITSPVTGDVGNVPLYILSWLRKPEYWSTTWRVYTPDTSADATDTEARSICETTLGTPGDSNALPTVNGAYRDVPHMAATALGYQTWGLPNNEASWGFGDFGGWALDLLQIWGSYQKDGNDADLATWMGQHIGLVNASGGFPYADVLADADGYELRRVLSAGFTGLGLSDAMRSLYQSAGPGRIASFYQHRFGASQENVAAAFTSFCTSDFTNFVVAKSEVLNHAGAASFPTVAQATTCGNAYAAFMADPHI